MFVYFFYINNIPYAVKVTFNGFPFAPKFKHVGKSENNLIPIIFFSKNCELSFSNLINRIRILIYYTLYYNKVVLGKPLKKHFNIDIRQYRFTPPPL